VLAAGTLLRRGGGLVLLDAAFVVTRPPAPCSAGSARQELRVHISRRNPNPDNQLTGTVTRTSHAKAGSRHNTSSHPHGQPNPSRVAEMTRKITYITCMRVHLMVVSERLRSTWGRHEIKTGE
jgi:hypothetical protein